MGPILLKHIIDELNGSLAGGVISKIHQIDERNVILKVLSRGSERRLLISAHHVFSRVHLTEKEYVNPPSPLRFCAYLRSRITNARIEGFSQDEGQRIARISLKKLIGDGVKAFTLICELTGKSANIILVDEKGGVLDALRYFKPEESTRAVFPGITLAPLPPLLPGAKEEMPSKDPGMPWNAAAEDYYSAKLKEEAFILERSRVRRVINDAEKKAGRKLENIKGDKARADKEIDFYKTGELLAANIGKVKRGAKEMEADDYTKYPSEKVKIKLDEKLGPRENVEKYFKRAKKAKVALELLKERIPEVEAEIEFIGGLGYELTEAKDMDDLKALEMELIEAGYVKGKALPPAKGPATEPIRRVRSSEGFEILCGRSAKGNDLIVKKYAKDEDVWLHAFKVPGSHVLIKTAGRAKDLTIKTVEEAASLAAFHSKARGSTNVEVLYAGAANVKKPKGAKPGMVTVKEFKTITVRPKEIG